MPLRSKRVGQTAGRRRPSAPKSQSISPFFRCAPMLPMKFFRPSITPDDEVAEEPDRVGDDVADDAGRLGQDAEQHVLEGDDLLDQPDGGVVDALPERLVGLAELLLHRRHALVGGLVLRRPACRSARRGARRSRRPSRRSRRATAVERLLAERLTLSSRPLTNVSTCVRPVGDALLRRLQLGVDAVGDLVDRQVDLAQVLAPRLGRASSRSALPSRRPTSSATCRCRPLPPRTCFVRGLGGVEARRRRCGWPRSPSP